MTAHDPDLMRRITLERDEAMRDALERAAKAVEECTIGGEAYRKAFKTAASLIRRLKG